MSVIYMPTLNADIPHVPALHAFAGAEHSPSTLAAVNGKISDATLIDTLDSRLSDARTPLAHKASHVSGGSDTFAGTDLLEAIVKRLQTTTGPTTLLMGAVADGEFLKRVGSTLIGAVAGGGEWTDATTFIHPTNTARNVIVGAATEALAHHRLNANGSAIFNHQEASVDIRFAGGSQSNLLFLQGSTNQIAIGHSSPTARLHLDDTDNALDFQIFVRVTHSASSATAGRGDSDVEIRNGRNVDAGTITDDYPNFFVRRESTTTAGGTFNSGGAVAKFENIVSGGGTNNNTVKVLELIQGALSTGDIINVTAGAAANAFRVASDGEVIIANGPTIALALGTNANSRIYHNGTDSFWDLRATGTGDLMVALAGSFPSPDPNTVHIWSGSAGSVVAFPDARLVVENNDKCGIQLLSPNADYSIIMFGSPASNLRGYIQYTNSAAATPDTLVFQTAGANRLWHSAGAFAFQEATTISTTAGNLTLAPTADVIVSSDFSHTGTNFGIFGTTPTTQPAAYTRNATIVEDRTLLASASATVTNNNNVLAALIVDLQSLGIIA